MKNNSLAMLATVSLVVAVGSMIGYIDPNTCVVENPDGFLTCEEAATQHLLVSAVAGVFGVVTLAGSVIRTRLAKSRVRKSQS